MVAGGMTTPKANSAAPLSPTAPSAAAPSTAAALAEAEPTEPSAAEASTDADGKAKAAKVKKDFLQSLGKPVGVPKRGAKQANM